MILLTVAGLSIITGFRTILLRVVPLRGVTGVFDTGAGGADCPVSAAPLTTFAPKSIAFFKNGYEFGSAHKIVNAFFISVALLAMRLANGILYA